MEVEFKNFFRKYLQLVIIITAIVFKFNVYPVCGSTKDDQLLILVIVDGFRWDYTDLFESPNLDKLIKNGVKAEKLIPVFPSKTFPNIFTIITGLYPEKHGLIANNIYDPLLDKRFSMRNGQRSNSAWYNGEPIWITAKNHGLVTAAYNIVGSDVKIKGQYPDFWAKFDANFPKSKRLNQIFDLIDKSGSYRPNIIITYLNDLDRAGHRFGPKNKNEIQKAVTRVDSFFGKLISGLEEKDNLDKTNIIIVSDHGMTDVSEDRLIFLEDYVDPAIANTVDWSPILALWPKSNNINEVYNKLKNKNSHLKIYLRNEIPARLKFRNNKRIAPIIGIADEGWSVFTRENIVRFGDRINGGAHGYDNSLESMAAVFIASGPAFKSDLKIPPIENIHLYNLMCRLLNIKPSKNDGDITKIDHILNK